MMGLRGESNLPMRETWKRRQERRDLTADDTRRMDTYGLSPRGASIQRREPINVYNDQKFQDLLRQSPSPHPPLSPSGPDSPRVKFTVHKTPQSARGAMKEATDAQKSDHAERGLSKKEWRRKMLAEQHALMEARMSANVARGMEQAKERRELRFQQNLKALADDREFAQECYALVDSQEELRKQKQKKLYKEWERDVFNKIQEQVIEAVDSLDIFDLERRKLELYKEYMKAENRMQEGIKRDVVIKSDYDPYAWKKHAVRYQGGQKLNDPVKRDLEKMYEDKLGPAGGRGEIPHHRTRVMIDPQMYDGAKLKGTPHGSVATPSPLPVTSLMMCATARKPILGMHAAIKRSPRTSPRTNVVRHIACNDLRRLFVSQDFRGHDGRPRQQQRDAAEDLRGPRQAVLQPLPPRRRQRRIGGGRDGWLQRDERQEALRADVKRGSVDIGGRVRVLMRMCHQQFLL